MAYALLTEGMSLETRAAFDLTLNIALDAPSEAPKPVGPSVAARNRDAVASWAALGVPITVPK